MSTVGTIAASITAITVIGTAVVAVVKEFSLITQRLELYDCTLQSIIRSNLIRQYKEYKRDGCTEQERMIWLTDYDRYHALHANGVIDFMKEDVVTWECEL